MPLAVYLSLIAFDIVIILMLLRCIRAHTPAQRACLAILIDGAIPMPATFQIGVNTSAVAVLTEQPNPPVGPITYASDNPAVATIDPNSGVITVVAAGVANISGTDNGNGVTASDSLTVLAAPPPPQTGTLTITVT